MNQEALETRCLMVMVLRVTEGPFQPSISLDSFPHTLGKIREVLEGVEGRGGRKLHG